MDPPGAAPIFLGLVADKTQRVRRILAMQAAAVSFLVISIFALFGRAILEYLNISLEALQAAGALLLLLVALELLTGNAKSMNDDSNTNVALVLPESFAPEHTEAAIVGLMLGTYDLGHYKSIKEIHPFLNPNFEKNYDFGY